MIEKRKAFAYIVQGGRIVLLHHPDQPEAGVQVPAGSMEAGETPEQAVLREAWEETGLEGLRIVRFLGRARVDLRPWGKAEWHDRWFFQLTLDAAAANVFGEAWERWEEYSSDGEPPIRFLMRWTSLDAVPPLIGGHDRFLSMLAEGESTSD